MKKIFLPILALCGMITGFTLTSCGGGGGGGNVSGTTIVMQSGIGYFIQFNEKVEGTGQTYRAKMWNDYNDETDLWITVTRAPEYNDNGKIISMEAEVSVTTLDYESCKIFYAIVNAMPAPEDGEEVTEMSLYAPASMNIQPYADPDNEGVVANLTWVLKTMVPIFDEEDDDKLVGYEEGEQVMPTQDVVGSYRG